MNTFYVSIIIATYNRQETLPETIKGLLTQKLGRSFDYEIIVVDNDSTDQTEAVVRGLIPSSAGKLKYIKQEIPGKSNALNMGIGESKGEIIAFTDDDVEVGDRWLCSLIECFDKYHCDAVGGRVLPVYPPQTPSWVSDHPNQMAGVVVIYDQGERTLPSDSTTPRFIGANWAFKKEVFKDCGLFKTDLGPGTPVMGEDEEFYYRLVQHQKKMYYCAEALIWHPVDLKRLSLTHTARWHISLGRFEATKEYKTKKENLILFAGVPRYIIKGIIVDFFLIPVNIFSKLKCRHYIRAFFRKWGMIEEYRNIRKIS